MSHAHSYATILADFKYYCKLANFREYSVEVMHATLDALIGKDAEARQAYKTANAEVWEELLEFGEKSVALRMYDACVHITDKWNANAMLKKWFTTIGDLYLNADVLVIDYIYKTPYVKISFVGI